MYTGVDYKPHIEETQYADLRGFPWKMKVFKFAMMKSSKWSPEVVQARWVCLIHV